VRDAKTYASTEASSYELRLVVWPVKIMAADPGST
jgi:hypothetical protein